MPRQTGVAVRIPLSDPQRQALRLLAKDAGQTQAAYIANLIQQDLAKRLRVALDKHTEQDRKRIARAEALRRAMLAAVETGKPGVERHVGW